MKRALAVILCAVALTGCKENTEKLRKAGLDAYDRGDYQTALINYRKAAEQGSAYAQLFVGTMYYEGSGVPRDFEEAAKWFRKAAEQGYPIALNNLAGMYAKGDGVPKDYVLAHMYINLAIVNILPSSRGAAVNMRSYLELQMAPEQLKEAQRLAREWKPKNQSAQYKAEYAEYKYAARKEEIIYTCESNLRQFSSAMAQYALENNLSTGDRIEPLSKLNDYLSNLTISTSCPAGGKYSSLDVVGTPPSCSKHGTQE